MPDALNCFLRRENEPNESTVQKRCYEFNLAWIWHEGRIYAHRQPKLIKGQFIWFPPEISQILEKKVDYNVTVYLLVVFGTAQIGLLVTFAPCFNLVQFFEVIPVTDQTHIYLTLL